VATLQDLIAAVALAKKYGTVPNVLFILDVTSGVLVPWDGVVDFSVAIAGGGTSGLTVDALGALRVTPSPDLIDVKWPQAAPFGSGGWGGGGW
jgi:hypothetical protein